MCPLEFRGLFSFSTHSLTNTWTSSLKDPPHPHLIHRHLIPYHQLIRRPKSDKNAFRPPLPLPRDQPPPLRCLPRLRDAGYMGFRRSLPLQRRVNQPLLLLLPNELVHNANDDSLSLPSLRQIRSHVIRRQRSALRRLDPLPRTLRPPCTLGVPFLRYPPLPPPFTPPPFSTTQGEDTVTTWGKRKSIINVPSPSCLKLTPPSSPVAVLSDDIPASPAPTSSILRHSVLHNLHNLDHLFRPLQPHLRGSSLHL